jgi:hypothetical protein
MDKDTWTKEMPRVADIFPSPLTKDEELSLMEFIESTIPSGDETVSLRYRPDEWDAAGAIRKVQETAKEYIQANYKVSGQLEPRRFVIRRVVDSSDVGEEYGNYESNGEILYHVGVSIPGSDGCTGGSVSYSNHARVVDVADKELAIHRCESINNWKSNTISDGSRLDLTILFQEISRVISYNYEIDQIEEELEDF